MKRIALLFGVCIILAFDRNSARAQSITIAVDQPGVSISPHLFGIFFEEINMAGEGGLYAEMVRNRSLGNSGTPQFWTSVSQSGGTGQMSIDTNQPLNSNAIESLELTMLSGTGTLGAGNQGFGGMVFKAGSNYNLSFYARGSNKSFSPIGARLESPDGTVLYAQTSFSGLTTNWQQFTTTLVPSNSSTNGRLVISISQPGTIWLNVVSLFPAATYHGRTNGLRVDLAGSLAALNPGFMRFPGGNYVNGYILSNAFQWKNTIGDIAQRPGHLDDAWGYWSTDGLGYHEYLQLCEDLGCEPVFAVNCGMALSETAAISEMGPYVQDALDAIEYANGDTTSAWGALRAANGHPASFNLKYIEIGNENSNSSYYSRYPLFYNAIKSRYPAIQLIATDTPPGQPVDVFDQHYYYSSLQVAPNYDNYNRNGPKIMVGEFELYSFEFGMLPSLEEAINQAAFMTGLERNCDVVAMASMAPLFAGLLQNWSPNEIYFNNNAWYGSPAYYAQLMFAQNRGDRVLPAAVNVSGVPSNSFYADACLDSTNGQIIIRIANLASTVPATVHLTGLDSVATNATVVVLTAANQTVGNSFANPTNVVPVTNSFVVPRNTFFYYLPSSSFAVFRLQANGIHTVTNVQLQIASPINAGQTVPSTLWGQEGGGGGTVNLLTNSTTARAVTVASADTTVAALDLNGNVTGVGPGTTSITATYQGMTSSQDVQVLGTPVPITSLIHRYSFDDGTANDSIGANNGTFFNASGFSAITNGQLYLTGSNGDYVDLGPDLITTNAISSGAVTFEAWATVNSTNGYGAGLFDFGTMSGGNGGNDIYLMAKSVYNGGNARLAVSDVLPESGDETGLLFSSLVGQTNVHLVAVFNPTSARQFLGIYSNGFVITSVPTGNKSIASIINDYSFLGRSLYSANAWLNGSIDEFRIYNGELSTNEILASDQLGSSLLLSTAPPMMQYLASGGYLTLTWPLASAGFSLFSAADPSSGNWISVYPAPQIINGQWQVTVPMSSAPQYFRLKR